MQCILFSKSTNSGEEWKSKLLDIALRVTQSDIITIK